MLAPRRPAQLPARREWASRLSARAAAAHLCPLAPFLIWQLSPSSRYRNAKLTRLLQECLAGNCSAAIVVTLRAEVVNLDECISTLRFAQRASAVQVKVVANVGAAQVDPVKLCAELRGATDELAEARRGRGGCGGGCWGCGCGAGMGRRAVAC